MDWFRFYSAALTDTKLGKLARQLSAPRALVLGVWATLLGLASESPERGRLLISANVPVDVGDIEALTGIENAKEWLGEMQALGMVDLDGGVWEIVNWDRRQFGSDNSTERVRRHREKVQVARSATGLKRDGSVAATPPHTETDTETDTETETETEITPPTRASRDMRRAAPDEADGGGGAGGIIFPPADLEADQAAAWELLLTAAADFNGADEFVRSHPPWLIGEWALALDGSQTATNPAGVIRSGVAGGKRPTLTTAQRVRWGRALAYYEDRARGRGS